MDIAIGCRIPVVSLGSQLGIVGTRRAVTEGRVFELEEKTDNPADTLEVALASTMQRKRWRRFLSLLESFACLES